MKIRVLLAFLLVAGLAIIWSCTTTPIRSGVVVADDRGIVIRATPLSDTDQQKMDEILAKYDTELYKIDTHVDGQFKKRRGTLRDVYTDKKLADSIAQDLHKQGFTHSAVRVGKYTAEGGVAANPQRTTSPSATPVGSGSNPQRVPGPSASPVGTGSNPQRVKQDQLINELMPILEKYK